MGVDSELVSRSGPYPYRDYTHAFFLLCRQPDFFPGDGRNSCFFGFMIPNWNMLLPSAASLFQVTVNGLQSVKSGSKVFYLGFYFLGSVRSK